MLNRDINSRFEDWLLVPRETLDFEVKQWIDMSDPESQGVVAKALIALENHGGGFLLFGYKEGDDKTLAPDPSRPESMQPYLTDALNAIVKRRAEPAFHVEVTLQKHPTTAEDYPLVRVAGTSRVPVRSDSATPAGSLKQNVYYIRAPGPESRAPLNAAEWDTLLRRAVANQREEIISLIRTLAPGGASGSIWQPPTTEADVLRSFSEQSLRRWAALNQALTAGQPGKIEHGHFSFAARVIGKSKALETRRVLELNEGARRYTGWPIFVSIRGEKGRPRLVDGCLEAWLGEEDSSDAGHADFWRIDPKAGNFFPLRGYQEDSLDPARGFGKPGTLFEVTLPVWRLGEFILRVLDLADSMYEQPYEVFLICEWTGLNGRHLFSFNMRRHVPAYAASQDTVRTEGGFPQNVLRELLPEAIKNLTKPLYEHFEFFAPPDNFFSEELAEMTKNRF